MFCPVKGSYSRGQKPPEAVNRAKKIEERHVSLSELSACAEYSHLSPVAFIIAARTKRQSCKHARC